MKPISGVIISETLMSGGSTCSRTLSNSHVMKKNTFFWLIAVGMFLSSCSATTVYVVRHGEKAAEPPKDPALTEQGSQRAEKLAALLGRKKITRIYTSNTQRTRMTASPLAEALGVKIELYNPTEQAAFLEKLRESRDNTLVVGHSNTLKQTLNGLTGQTVLSADLDESEYNRLYTVKKQKSGKMKVKMTRY